MVVAQDRGGDWGDGGERAQGFHGAEGMSTGGADGQPQRLNTDEHQGSLANKHPCMAPLPSVHHPVQV